MEFVTVFDPSVSDVFAVVHVGDEYVFNAVVCLLLCLFHCWANAADDEDDAGVSCDKPFSVDVFDVFDVDAFCWSFKEDYGIF